MQRFLNYKFKNGKVAANRLVIPPMASETADINGFATDATIHHYQRLAGARAGIVFVEYSYIHRSGRSEPNQLSADHDDKLEGLVRIANTLRSSGSLAGLQIVHAGAKTRAEFAGGSPMGASPIPIPVKGIPFEIPEEMTEAQVENWRDWFLAAAERARAAGFDIVELHAAHGYGLNQWLSPITNQRKDSWGGSIQGRSKLLFMIVDEIKTKVPDILLSVRLPAQDYFTGGLTIAEMAWVARELELRGVDLIDVSSGIGGWRRPERRVGQGYLVDDAEALKAHISVPVIGVGGIEEPSFIDEILLHRRVDFAAVGRAILSDPRDWGEKFHSESIISYRSA